MKSSHSKHLRTAARSFGAHLGADSALRSDVPPRVPRGGPVSGGMRRAVINYNRREITGGQTGRLRGRIAGTQHDHASHHWRIRKDSRHTLRAGFFESPSRSSPANYFGPADPNGPSHTVTRNVTFHGRLF